MHQHLLQAPQQCLTKSPLRRNKIRRRPLQQRGFIVVGTTCSAENRKHTCCDIVDGWRSFVVTMMILLLTVSNSRCAAFHFTLPRGMKYNMAQRLLQRRIVATQRPFVSQRTVGRLFVQQSSDEVIRSNVTMNTSSFTNQSAIPLLIDHSLHSDPLLRQTQPPPPPPAAAAPFTILSTATVSFGDVVGRKETSILSDSKPLSMSDSTTTTATTDTPSFGDVVSLKRPMSTMTPAVAVASSSTVVAIPVISEERKIANQIRFRNTVVAVLSIAVAIGNFMYQYVHPIEPIQILFDLQQSSSDISVVGKNHKPTIIDFWAPWCENCKFSAATLQSIEQQYGDDVNFILINGDAPSSWPYIEALGVDAIPHMAMISYDGVVETALIGPIPKHILQEDIEVLLRNSRNNAAAATWDVVPNDPTVRDMPLTEHIELPHKMLDVFAGKPDSTRRVQF